MKVDIGWPSVIFPDVCADVFLLLRFSPIRRIRDAISWRTRGQVSKTAGTRIDIPIIESRSSLTSSLCVGQRRSGSVHRFERERERERIDNSEIASESGIRSRGCARCQGLESNGRTPVCAFLLRVIYAPMPIELCSPFPYPPEENGVGLDRRLNSIEHPVLLASNKEAAFLLPNSIFPFRA